jgi:hypothetical protein
MAKAASEGMFIGQFDISNAFASAALGGERVFLRLPPQFSDGPKGSLVRLLKSLYGLRIAPRRWYDCFSKKLKGFGWVFSTREPGICAKTVNGVTTWTGICVDGSFVAFTEKTLLDKEMARTLSPEGCKGKLIESTFADSDVHVGAEIRDVLGATLRYNR